MKKVTMIIENHMFNEIRSRLIAMNLYFLECASVDLDSFLQ